MDHIKKYESFFDIFKKKDDFQIPQDWKGILDVVKKEFENLKKGNKTSLVSSEISKITDGYMLSCINYKGKFAITLVPKSEDGEFSIYNDSNFRSKKFEHEKTNITENEFNEINTFCKEVSDWLDDKSDKKIGKSKIRS